MAKNKIFFRTSLSFSSFDCKPLANIQICNEPYLKCPESKEGTKVVSFIVKSLVFTNLENTVEEIARQT